jgi:hypothetical protein
VILTMLDNTTQGELQRCENNYKALNLITAALGRNVCDRVAHLVTSHDAGLNCATLMRAHLKLNLLIRTCTIGNKPGESLNDCFARFESIVSNLRSCGPLAYFDNERVKQFLYALGDHVWGMKITALKESTNFATLDTKKLFSKLKSYELSMKGHLNHDASLSSKAFITSTHVGGHDANPTNTTVSSTLEFTLFSLVAASGEQYGSIPDNEIAC